MTISIFQLQHKNPPTAAVKVVNEMVRYRGGLEWE